MIQVAVINASTCVSEAELAAAVKALQVQVSRDFAPAWGIDAQLEPFTHAEAAAGRIPADAWWLSILDNSDEAGALGYHDVTPAGAPLGKSFAGTDKQYGESWTGTLSHELLEMLADPEINRCVLVPHPDPKHHRLDGLFAYEVCDACESDQFGYDIDGIAVSDFVTPAWFQPSLAGRKARFDFGGYIGAPMALLPGGYISVMYLGAGHGWTQITADHAAQHAVGAMRAMRPAVGSRRERRATHRSTWRASALKAG